MKRLYSFGIGLLLCFSINVFSTPERSSIEESSDFQFKGTHFFASYTKCNDASLTDVEGLSKMMLKAAEESGATVLKSEEYVFPPNGFTMVVLLSESHASIHTYPEHQACFVDLFTCGNHCSFKKFDQVLRDYLEPAEVNSKVLSRGETIDEIYLSDIDNFQQDNNQLQDQSS